MAQKIKGQTTDWIELGWWGKMESSSVLRSVDRPLCPPSLSYPRGVKAFPSALEINNGKNFHEE
jgi:hypothetical protein